MRDSVRQRCPRPRRSCRRGRSRGCRRRRRRERRTADRRPVLSRRLPRTETTGRLPSRTNGGREQRYWFDPHDVTKQRRGGAQYPIPPRHLQHPLSYPRARSSYPPSCSPFTCPFSLLHVFDVPAPGSKRGAWTTAFWLLRVCARKALMKKLSSLLFSLFLCLIENR